jgi:hypothetical protein
MQYIPPAVAQQFYTGVPPGFQTIPVQQGMMMAGTDHSMIPVNAGGGYMQHGYRMLPEPIWHNGGQLKNPNAAVAIDPARMQRLQKTLAGCKIIPGEQTTSAAAAAQRK